MSAAARRVLWGTIAAGTAVRVWLAFKNVGIPYDIDSYRVVADALKDGHPLELYRQVNGDGLQLRWPYPPGYFPFILAADRVADHTSLAFHGLIQLPAIAADAAIAWFVQDFLGRRGATAAKRLAAAALVALGPSFIVISGHHGQIDSLAILPAVIALWLWEREGRSPLAVGALIGAGAAIKTVPILMLLALVPAARSRREALELVVGAVLVPLVLTAPFLHADFDGTLDSLRYRGIPGIGGISLLVQPDLAESWLSTFEFDFNGASEWLRDHGSLITFAGLGAVGTFLGRRRPSATDGAVLVWLAVYVFGVNFSFQYLVWGLPFFLMAGWVWETAALQALLLTPTLVLYYGPHDDPEVARAYTPFMLAALAAFAAALVLRVRALARVPERAG